MDYEIAMALRHTEIWCEFCCTIKGRKLLEVSSYGRRRVTNLKSGKVLKFGYGYDHNGYKVFGGFGLAHRCIASAFIENPLCKPQVNHIDGNKSNNHINNLERVTQSENTRHAFDTGLVDISAETKRKQSIAKTGNKHSQYNHTIYNFFNNKTNEKLSCTQYDLRTEFGLHQSNLSQVCSGDRKHCKGWIIVDRYYTHWYDNALGIIIE